MIAIKTAVLMPTYNRKVVLEDTLTACLGLYNKFNFDVYVFDSSEDDESEKVVKKFQTTHSNLYYVRCCSLMNMDCKFIEAIRGFHLKKDYDYVYVCGDANSLTEFALNRIYPYLQEGVDLVNIREDKITQTTEWNDANAYFHSELPNVGTWWAIICNKRTLLNMNEEDWNNAIGKWAKTEYRIYIHIGFWFDRLAQCKTLRIVEPLMGEKPADTLRRSKYKKESCWVIDMLEVATIIHPKVIYALPDIYTGKKEYIRKWLLLDAYRFNSAEYFYQLKADKCFTTKDYYKYKKVFKEYNVDTMGFKVLLIALLPLFLSKSILAISKFIHIYKTKKDIRLYLFGAKFTIFPRFDKPKP